MPSPSRKKPFTVEQANAMLPLVSVIARDLVGLAREVVDRQERLDHLTMGREMDSSDPYEEELTQVKRELEKDKGRLREYVAELEQLGVKVTSTTEGVVDFPSRLEGRPVMLCWRLGEPELLFWHEVDAGFSGRHPLAAATLAGNDGDDSPSNMSL